jgi:hypothetical protein
MANRRHSQPALAADRDALETIGNLDPFAAVPIGWPAFAAP